ncbi:MAG: LytTR family DNA-binding domain-containing protein [Bacteroidota bacterium]
MRAIIVEDEEGGMENIVLKLKKYCPEVEIVGTYDTGESAVRAIRDKAPQLVFLDIHLGTMSGFDVLSKVSYIPLEIIFTTAHDEYLLDAIRLSAVDYILKPIRPTELKGAVQRAAERIQNQREISRILLPDGNNQLVLRTREIMYCLADNVNTFVHRENKRPFLAVKTLKSVESMLPRDTFHRVSRGALVNINFVEALHRSDGGYIRMIDGKELSISKSRLDDFLRKLGRNF